MLYGIGTSALGAHVQQMRLDTIANNLANINTTGYRGDRISFKSVLAGAVGGSQGGNVYESIAAPTIDRVSFDTSLGAMEDTGNPLDLAIEGNGFFTVRSLENGKNYYTRAGNFTFNSSGQVVTQDGKYALTSAGGEPITLAEGVTAGNLLIDEAGGIYMGDTQIGAVGLVDFDDYTKLRKFGNTLFENTGANGRTAVEANIRQGVIEGASVNPIEELVAMIEGMRTLETNLQMIRFQDSTLEKAV